MGESDTEDRATDAVQKAIDNPILDVDIGGATGALINVAGGEDLTLDEITHRMKKRLKRKLKKVSASHHQTNLVLIGIVAIVAVIALFLLYSRCA